ncbi:MAG: hypothetical protein P1U56_16995 [Saprospiraceae bacterium]|nr:hypothetical protein [Saprospiraceae bacterium]
MKAKLYVVMIAFFGPVFSLPFTQGKVGNAAMKKEVWHCSVGENFELEHKDYIPMHIEKEVSTRANRLRSQLSLTGQKLKIPVYAHRFQPSSIICQSGYPDYTASEAQINAEISNTNQIYSDVGLNVELVLIDIEEHNNNLAVTMDLLLCQSEGYKESYDELFWSLYGNEGAINLFCVESDSPSMQHAYFPNGDFPNMIVLKFYHDGWSTAHEVGHTFTLYHTFETSNGSENVTRDTSNTNYNADSNGDLLSDTDATINLDFYDNSIVTLNDSDCESDCSCTMTWVGSPSDGTGEPYLLNVGVWDNLMNYGSRDCSRIFTPMQVDRMWDGILTKIDLDQFDFCLLGSSVACPLNLILGNSEIDYGQYLQASNSISTTQEITVDHQETRMNADLIQLKPGFNAKAEGTSHMLVELEGCSCN